MSAHKEILLSVDTLVAQADGNTKKRIPLAGAVHHDARTHELNEHRKVPSSKAVVEAAP